MTNTQFFSIIFESVPEVTIFLTTSLIFLGYRLEGRMWRIITLGVINGLITGLCYQYLPLGYNTLIGLVTMTLSLKYLFDIDVTRSLIIIIFGGILLGVLEAIFISLWQVVFNLSAANLMEHAARFTGITYPHLLVLGSAGYFAYRNGWYLLKLSSIVISRQNLALINMVLVLIFLIVIFNNTVLITQSGRTSVIFDFMVKYPLIMNTLFAAVLIFSVLHIRQLFSMVEKDAIVRAQDTYAASVDDLFNSYRAQRHDFHNHMQTVYSMIAQTGCTEALHYIDGVMDTFQELNDLMRLKHSAVAALLKAKQALASVHNITFKVNITSTLEDIKIKPHELVTILGNLIDNAVEVVQYAEQKNRWIEVQISSFTKFYLFKVINPGPVLSDEQLQKLFEQGYSTKNGGSGLGLNTVKRLVEANKGDVIVSSNRDRGTEFTFVIPRGNEHV